MRTKDNYINIALSNYVLCKILVIGMTANEIYKLE